MWWMYVKVFEDDERIRYAYARDSKLVSGFVDYFKGTDEVEMITPAEMDANADYAQDRALRHVYTVKRDGFPDRRMVATG